MSDTLVTGYHTPDLDGTACAIAYSEFLNREGGDTVPALFGTPNREASWVLDRTEKDYREGVEALEQTENVILVDASDFRGLDDKINPEDVVEFIDHREEHHAEEFPEAESQVEMVGAAASLIAEKFFEQNVEISEDSALLLYGAIISNTMNFEAGVTTKRDREMAGWLKQKIDVKEDFERKMFEHKSELEGSLKQVFLADQASETYDGKDVGVIQLEIVDIDSFVENNKQEALEVLEEIREEKGWDYIFLTCADLEEGFNIFISPGKETREILSSALDVEFSEKEASRSDVLLRKEIIPKIKQEIQP
ncbi:MAG: DHH family phosphoesterase [Candidatus Nanohaloarchaea archaeon]